MAEKICATCGAELPASAIFCNQCGNRDLREVGAGGQAPSPVESTITADSPTIPVEAPLPPPPGRMPPPPLSSPAGTPTLAGPTVMDDRTSVWSPAAPAPQYSSGASGPLPAPPVTVGQPVPPVAPLPTAAASGGGGRFGAALLLVGGAVAIVGAFLDWMKITPDWAEAFTLSGWASTDDAKIALVLGGLAVVAAVVVLGGALRGPIRLIAAVLGIALIGVGAYDTYDIIQRLPDALEKAGVSGIRIDAPGIGLILVIVGGVVVLLGALAMSAGVANPEPAVVGGPPAEVPSSLGTATAPPTPSAAAGFGAESSPWAGSSPTTPPTGGFSPTGGHSSPYSDPGSPSNPGGYPPPPQR